MSKIIVVGLGPGSSELLTLQGVRVIENSESIWLRTTRHPVVDFFDEKNIKYNSFDDIFENYDTFDEVYSKIADKLIQEMNNSEAVVYAVPGSPTVSERVVELLKEQGVDLEFVHGISFVDAAVSVLELSTINQLTIVEAVWINSGVMTSLNQNLITQVYNKMLASDIKLFLMEHYSDETIVKIVQSPGVIHEQKVIDISLQDLDSYDGFNYLTNIYVPALESSTVNYLSELVDVMKKLRGIKGCPWDREQTHESLREYLIEEVYEVIDAIDQENMALLEEELGDLLLQVIFHSEIASESGYFNYLDVITGIVKKMKRRHPHVFDKQNNITIDQLNKQWDEIKKQEKSESVTESLINIPKKLPNLMRSFKIQKKAAKVGFDWPTLDGVLNKIDEEIGEVKEAVLTKDQLKIEQELGDLLFSAVNLCRVLECNPEIVLEKTNEKFINRFSFIEANACKYKKTLEELTLQEMDELWNLAKNVKNT